MTNRGCIFRFRFRLTGWEVVKQKLFWNDGFITRKFIRAKRNIAKIVQCVLAFTLWTFAPLSIRFLFVWIALSDFSLFFLLYCTPFFPQIKRDENVNKLLNISQSAIYLNFVWRHLSNNRQEQLDKFLTTRKTFRGVFFVEPDARKIFTSVTKAKTQLSITVSSRIHPRRGILQRKLVIRHKQPELVSNVAKKIEEVVATYSTYRLFSPWK
jgi:hypothetical protein